MNIETYISIIKAGIVGLYNRQDVDEQTSHTTRYINNSGFNAFDAGFGTSLAEKILSNQELTPKQIIKAADMLRKYKKQLESMSIQLPDEPPKELQMLVEVNGTINRYGNGFKFTFDYNKDLVAAIKQIEGIRYYPEDHSWVLSNLDKQKISITKDFAEKNKFEFTDEAIVLINEIENEKIKQEKVIEKYIDTRKNTFNRITTDVLSIHFPYDPKLVSAVKSIGTVIFTSDVKEKYWKVPKLSDEIINKINKFAQDNEFIITNNAKKLINEFIQKEKEYSELRKENLVASSAEDAKIEIHGLGGELRPFQKAGVAYALKNKRCFIADEMGLGKTVQALATIHAANAYPALIVCPASLKYNWQNEANKWNKGKSTSILADGTIGDENKDIVIINYDILEKRKEELNKIPFKSIIFDESQYCKNYKAKRTKAAQELSQGAEYRLALTGTPILNRPQELMSQLQILGRLNDMGGFWNFAKRYCNAKQTRYGWDMSGASNLEELNTRLRQNCYIRRNKKDIIKELPPIQRVVVPVDINNKAEYKKAEHDLTDFIKEKIRKDEEFQDSIKNLSEEDKKKKIAEHENNAITKAERAEQLTRIEATKQIAAKGKIDAIKEWVNNFIESGEKLVIFADHQDIINNLSDTFNADKIDGSTSAEDRQKAVERFQKDPESKIIVCNIKAGGVGLTLTAASNVAFVEQGWNPGTHDQAEARCYGRINDPHAVTAWYFLGKDTVDEKIYELIQRKRKVINEATTGDATDSNSNTIFKDLLQSITQKDTRQKIASVPNPVKEAEYKPKHVKIKTYMQKRKQNREYNNTSIVTMR